MNGFCNQVVEITLKLLLILMDKDFSGLFHFRIFKPILHAEHFAKRAIPILNFTTNLLITNHATVLRWKLDLQ